MTKKIILSYLEFITVLDLGIGILLLKDIPKDPEELRLEQTLADIGLWGIIPIFEESTIVAPFPLGPLTEKRIKTLVPSLLR